MTRDDIIKMAREAGFQTGCLYPQNGKGEPTLLVCALGTSYTVEVEKLIRAAYAVGAAAEREACAKVCDEYDISDDVSMCDTAEGIAAAIRARSEK